MTYISLMMVREMLTACNFLFKYRQGYLIYIASFLTSLILISNFTMTFSFAGELTDQRSLNELFTSISDADELMLKVDKEKVKGLAILRTRYVKVNFDYLVGKEYPDGKERITLDLFDDLKVTGIKDHLEWRSFERYTWFGQVEEVENSQIIIVVEKSIMAANITIGERIFQVRAIDNAVHAIHEIDQRAYSDACDPIPVVLEKSYDSLSPTTSADEGPYIDVLVVYSDDTARASVNIEAEIQLAIDETNQSYINSNINQRLRLVHSQEVIYAETVDMEADLDCITFYDGCLDEVHEWRDDYGGDMVSFWVENGNYCGIAWLMQMESHLFEEYAFSVVDRSCATGYYAFGHELGHNMGAHHDRANASEEGAFPYSYGYQDPQENWRTIMAYNCPTGCSRVQYWSNPDVRYFGTPMGVSAGQPDSADNHRTLNNTADTVSGFRPCRDDDDDGYPHYDNCGAPQDCDDSNFAINPGAEDLCDGTDNDCDGSIDEDFPSPLIIPPLLPNSAKQGSANLDVTINGSGFVDGATCQFCAQVSVNSCSFVSENQMIANISMDSLVELGFYDLSIINPECGDVTCTECFEVTFDCQNADMVADGRIDGLDLGFLGRAFGMDENINPETWWHDADLDGNGMVDGNDLALLAANFGEDSSFCD